MYAPTSNAPDEDIQLFYEDLNKSFFKCKSPEVRIVMGDFNANVANAVNQELQEYMNLATKTNRVKSLLRGEIWQNNVRKRRC